MVLCHWVISRWQLRDADGRCEGWHYVHQLREMPLCSKHLCLIYFLLCFHSSWWRNESLSWCNTEIWSWSAIMWFMFVVLALVLLLVDVGFWTTRPCKGVFIVHSLFSAYYWRLIYSYCKIWCEYETSHHENLQKWSNYFMFESEILCAPIRRSANEIPVSNIKFLIFSVINV